MESKRVFFVAHVRFVVSGVQCSGHSKQLSEVDTVDAAENLCVSTKKMGRFCL